MENLFCLSPVSLSVQVSGEETRGAELLQNRGKRILRFQGNAVVAQGWTGRKDEQAQTMREKVSLRGRGAGAKEKLL